jgi:hypothetical protein
MQPTFMPWAGYIELISTTDIFIFLDDVKYSHQSWQNRNYLSISGSKWLSSIAVINPKNSQLLLDVKLNNIDFQKKKLTKTFQQAYSKSEYIGWAIKLINEYFSKDDRSLSDRNALLIKDICKFLSIETTFLFSSDLSSFGNRAQYVANLLKEVNATTYVSALGSKNYIEDFGLQYFPCHIEYFHYEKSNKLPKCKDGTNWSVVHHILTNSLSRDYFGKNYESG